MKVTTHPSQLEDTHLPTFRHLTDRGVNYEEAMEAALALGNIEEVRDDMTEPPAEYEVFNAVEAAGGSVAVGNARIVVRPGERLVVIEQGAEAVSFYAPETGWTGGPRAPLRPAAVNSRAALYIAILKQAGASGVTRVNAMREFTEAATYRRNGRTEYDWTRRNRVGYSLRLSRRVRRIVWAATAH